MDKINIGKETTAEWIYNNKWKVVMEAIEMYIQHCMCEIDSYAIPIKMAFDKHKLVEVYIFLNDSLRFVAILLASSVFKYQSILYIYTIHNV